MLLNFSVSSKCFLVDIGAEVSVYPALEEQRREFCPVFDLEGPDGTRIPSFGFKQLEIFINSKSFLDPSTNSSGSLEAVDSKSYKRTS